MRFIDQNTQSRVMGGIVVAGVPARVGVAVPIPPTLALWNWIKNGERAPHPAPEWRTLAIPIAVGHGSGIHPEFNYDSCIGTNLIPCNANHEYAISGPGPIPVHRPLISHFTSFNYETSTLLMITHIITILHPSIPYHTYLIVSWRRAAPAVRWLIITMTMVKYHTSRMWCRINGSIISFYNSFRQHFWLVAMLRNVCCRCWHTSGHNGSPLRLYLLSICAPMESELKG